MDRTGHVRMLTEAEKRLLVGARASLLGARTLLGAPGLTTRSKKLFGWRPSLVGWRRLKNQMNGAKKASKGGLKTEGAGSCGNRPCRNLYERFHLGLLGLWQLWASGEQRQRTTLKERVY